VLVLHDLIGLSYQPPAKFVRRYVDLRETLHQVVANFRADVMEGRFPDDRESYHWPPALSRQFEKETAHSG
jgi:3-methyl-2-oxobutanoate hydroxymethyltransferase